MKTQIFINSIFNETRIAAVENNKVTELFIERKFHPHMVGNIYKGRIGKIIPGMQAAFINIGTEKAGFISVEDVYKESILEQFFDEKELSDTDQSDKLIQDLLKEGQDVIVQTIKEPVSGKGAKLTSYIGIPSKHLVLLGTVDIAGVSRKIEENEERERLLKIIKKYKPKDAGFIARTSSKDIETSELIKEIKQLNKLWNKIKRKFKSAKKPSILYETPDLYIKVIRDFINSLATVYVDSEKVYKDINKVYSGNGGNNKFNIELYKDDEPIFEKYNIEDQIKKIYRKKVWLKSGGHLIIDETEGLTVIDVNTGKYVSKGEQEETILKINNEAIVEAARQIRLRNLVGIIVIDLIDLKNKESKNILYSNFEKELRKDRARVVLNDISPFFVLQLTRQRIRESVLSNLVEPCYVCNGTGKLKSIDYICYEILREIKYKSSLNSNKILTVYCNKEIIKKIREIEGINVRKIQKNNNTKIKFKKTDDFIENYNIVIS